MMTTTTKKRWLEGGSPEEEEKEAMNMRIEIAYLGEVLQRDPTIAHNGWAGGCCYDGQHVETRKVEPTYLDLDLPPEVPQIRVGWGDSGRHAADLSIYTDRDSGGVTVELHGPDGLRATRDGYSVPFPAWVTPEMIDRIVTAIRTAAVRAARERPDVAAVIARSAASLAEIDYEYSPETTAKRAAVIAREAGRLGRRRLISRDEAAAIIGRLAAAGVPDQNVAATRWAAMIEGATVVSATGTGGIRYDAPGSAHPQYRAALAFVARAADDGTRRWSRAHAAKVVEVATCVGPRKRHKRERRENDYLDR